MAKMVTCRTCGGNRRVTCTGPCRGAGTFVERGGGPGGKDRTLTCGACNGARTLPCDGCNGTGQVES